MENNNNGRGIFYGVIGVATLVVAIIGATFAYFSAQVGANDAINVASTTVELRMTGIDSNFKTDMIPVDTVNDDGPVTAFYTFPGITKTGQGAGTCVDLVGNSICGVYTFTIENPSSTTAQTVVGSLTTTANTGFANLNYAVFKGKAADIDSYNVNATLVDTNDESATDGSLIYKGVIPAMTDTDNLTHTWTRSKELLDKNDSTSYTIVVWLEETGVAQDAEQGKTFAASILFASPEGGGVTGVLTSST